MTTNAGRTLNQENMLPISAYIALHVLTLWGLAFGLSWNEGLYSWIEKVSASSAWLIISGVLTTILNGQIKPHWKAVLVFWRLSHPLPGCRAFSYHMQDDSRIDPTVLEERYGQLPGDPVAQNRLWYRIYKKHHTKPIIEDVHRKFLLTRDLMSISLVFFPVLIGASFSLLKSVQMSFAYTGFLLIVLWLKCQSARTYGVKFVCNVLAEESTVDVTELKSKEEA
jgi:hypothetical protein